MIAPDTTRNCASRRKTLSPPILCALSFIALAALGPHAAQADPTPLGDVDFCLHYAQMSPFLALFPPSCAPLATQFDADTGDGNGSLSITTTTTEDPGHPGDPDYYQVEVVSMTVDGNGLLDASNELALLRIILNDPLFDNGVLNHTALAEAWQDNWDQLVGYRTNGCHGAALGHWEE